MKPALRDAVRSLILLVGSTAAGLGANAISPTGIRWLAPDGPGAWTWRAPRISPDELGRRVRQGQALLLLDLREDEAFRAGHPKGAVHAPWSRFAAFYGSSELPVLLKSARAVVLLCGSERCDVADRTARQLRDLGHEQVLVLEDGWEGYRKSGLEIDGP